MRSLRQNYFTNILIAEYNVKNNGKILNFLLLLTKWEIKENWKNIEESRTHSTIMQK